jgi:hypothetical protein
MATNLADTWDDLVKRTAQNLQNYNPNEQINMQDARLTNVETERQNEIRSTTDQYNSMINNADQFYDRQAQVARENAQRQQELQNASTEQQVKEINQQREKTERDYQKEQRGAYTDYQKQVNEYGVNAEIMASRGLAGTGYAESSQVSMYNAYQNRVAMARQSLADSQQNYDNLIAQARLNNDTKQAEIANELAKAQAEYALQGFQYKNTLIESRQQQLNNLNSRYDTRYNTMLNLMQGELDAKRENYKTGVNILNYAEQQRQWAKEFDESNRRFDAEMAQKDRQFEKELAWEKQKWKQEYALERQRLQASVKSAKSYSIDPYSGGDESTGEAIRADAQTKQITEDELKNRIELEYSYNPFTGNLPTGRVRDKSTGKTFNDVNEMKRYLAEHYGYVIR